MIANKVALLVAASRYDDPKFGKLRAPAHDVNALARVLADPAVGGFYVQTLFDQPAWLIKQVVEGFFADHGRDDLLVLYFSCHGVKNPAGRLYFVVTDTRSDQLVSTGISSAWINEQLDRSRSQRVAVLLDCRYSGSYARGLAPKAEESVQILESLEGRGRAVITASDAMEYTYEGDELSLEAGRPSLFTRTLVEGLETGEADLDHDGLVSIRELYNYVYDNIRRLTPHETPTWSAHGLKGDLYLAKNPARFNRLLELATIPLKVIGVRVEKIEGQPDCPILLLREPHEGGRYLSIWIGVPEATAIAYVLNNIRPAKPMTHDLMKNILNKCSVVEMLAISEMVGGTFNAVVRLRSNGIRHDFLARPSDVTALAVRLEMPIFTSDELLNQCGLVIPGEKLEK